MYTLTNTTSIKRDSDGAMIPNDPMNVDYRVYLAWVAAGGVPNPVPPPTSQQQKDALQAQIDTLERAALENRKWREYSILEMEKAAIAFGAAQVPALTAAESLAYVYATNIAYKKTKDVDSQIIILRTQMDAIP